MRLANALTAPTIGVVLVILLAPVAPVAATLLVGAAVTTAITWRANTDRYGLVGALYLLGVGISVFLVGRFPVPWRRTPLFALWGFGTLSLVIFSLRVVLGVVGRRVVALFVADENANSVWDALSAFGGTLVIAWSVVTAQEKAVRIGGLTIGTTATTVLDALGYDVPMFARLLQRYATVTLAGYEFVVPLWALRDGIDATMVVFVGCLILGFHTLGTLAATWRAVLDTTDVATDQIESADGDRAQSTATSDGSSNSDQSR